MMYSRPRRFLREAATTAVLAAATAALAFPTPSTTEHIPGAILLILLAAAFLIELLPINYPQRAEATLSTLPAILLWSYLGSFAAAVAVGGAVALVQLARGRPSPVLSAAVAIVSIVLANNVSAFVIAAPPVAAGTATWVGAVVFGLAYSLLAPVLGRLVFESSQGPFELISGLAVTPAAVTLIEIVQLQGGVDTVSPALLGLLLAAFGGVILLVRANVDILTLNRRVSTVAARNEETA